MKLLYHHQYPWNSTSITLMNVLVDRETLSHTWRRYQRRIYMTLYVDTNYTVSKQYTSPFNVKHYSCLMPRTVKTSFQGYDVKLYESNRMVPESWECTGKRGSERGGVTYRSAHAAFLGRECGTYIAARHMPTGS